MFFGKKRYVLGSLVLLLFLPVLLTASPISQVPFHWPSSTAFVPQLSPKALLCHTPVQWRSRGREEGTGGDKSGRDSVANGEETREERGKGQRDGGGWGKRHRKRGEYCRCRRMGNISERNGGTEGKRGKKWQETGTERIGEGEGAKKGRNRGTEERRETEENGREGWRGRDKEERMRRGLRAGRSKKERIDRIYGGEQRYRKWKGKEYRKRGDMWKRKMGEKDRRIEMRWYRRRVGRWEEMGERKWWQGGERREERRGEGINKTEEGWRSYRRRCGKDPEESRRDRTENERRERIRGMKGKGGKIVKGTGN
jgi:hypothetical protein